VEKRQDYFFFFTFVPTNNLVSWGRESTGVAEFLAVSMLCIRQVSGLNIGLETGYPDRSFRGFPRYRQANVGITP
jgi:hypothetical protein